MELAEKELLFQDPYVCDPHYYLATQGIGGWHGAKFRSDHRQPSPCTACGKSVVWDRDMSAWKDATHYILEEP
jgi:hypothetical protein